MKKFVAASAADFNNVLSRVCVSICRGEMNTFAGFSESKRRGKMTHKDKVSFILKQLRAKVLWGKNMSVKV